MNATRMLALLLVAVSCGKPEAAPAGKGKGERKLEYPVEVALLVLRAVQYEVNAPGSIDAFQQVQMHNSHNPDLSWPSIAVPSAVR